MHEAAYRHRRNYNDQGDAHELTFSRCQGYQFMKAERTCQWLAKSIKAARVNLDTDLWAFVFMPEHIHLIMQPRQPGYDIAVIRNAIKEPVARHASSDL